jgi:hypothetical protein
MVKLAACALVLCGCGTYYAFVPQSPPVTTVKAFNRDAAFYNIPEGSPHGDLRIVSYGVERLVAGNPDAPNADDPTAAAIHLRVMLENTGQQPWSFDTREQQIDMEGQGTETVAYAVSDREGDGPPVVQLPFGVTRVVDLFYPLPPGMDDAAEIPAFRAITLVHTDAGNVVETTPFRRIEIGLLSPYLQQDIVADDAYDYLDEEFWFNGVGTSFGGGHFAVRDRVYSRGHGIVGTSPGTRNGGGRSSGGRGGHRGGSHGGHAGSHGGGHSGGHR